MESTKNMNSNPSIYIPRVHSNITWKRVKDVFEEIFGTGTIGRVDITKIRRSEGDNLPFNRAFVHFKHWPKEFNQLREQLVAGETIKIVYDDPWFWKCLLNKYPRTLDKDGTKRPRKAPYAEVEQSASSSSSPGSPNPMRRGKTNAAPRAPPKLESANSFAALQEEASELSPAEE